MPLVTALSMNAPANDTTPLPCADPLPLRLDRRTLERARLYDAWRAVYDGERRGDTLHARCEGSLGEAWRVRVELSSSPVRASCTCPVGGDGGCKHVGAALLAWHRDPEAFRVRPTLADALRALDADALRTMLLRLAARSEELERVVTSLLSDPVEEPVATSWGDRVGRLFRQRAGDAEAGQELATMLDEMLDEVRADDDPARVARLHGEALRGVLGRARRLGDGAAPLRAVVRRCIGAVAEASTRIVDDDARREALWSLVDLVSFDIERGVAAHASAPGRLAVQRAVEHAAVDDRRWLAARVRDRMRDADAWALRAWTAAYATLTEGCMEDGPWLDLCREHQLHALMAGRLLRLDRVPEALLAASRVGDGALLELAESFTHAGHGDALATLVSARVDRCSEFHRARFAAWLTARAEARRDDLAAVAVAERVTLAHPNREALAALRVAANRAGRWSEVRARVYAQLEAAAQPLLAEALLQDGELGRAVEFVTAPRALTPAFRAAREALLPHLEGSDPRAAARVLHAQALGLIAQRGRAGYAGACASLARARRLLAAVGEEAVAAEWIEALRTRHAKLPALVQLLDLHFGEPSRAAG